MYLFRHKGSHGIDHRTEKERLKKEYFRRLRLRLVLGTGLSAKNKIQAFVSWAVPALRFSFGIFKWLQGELHKLDRKTRKVL
jgi:hypothetical protein